MKNLRSRVFIWPELPDTRDLKATLVTTTARSREQNHFVSVAILTPAGAAQDLQCEYVADDFAVKNISVRKSFLKAIESNLIQDSTSSRSSGFVKVHDVGHGTGFWACMLRKYGRPIHYSEKGLANLRCKSKDIRRPSSLFIGLINSFSFDC